VKVAEPLMMSYKEWKLEERTKLNKNKVYKNFSNRDMKDTIKKATSRIRSDALVTKTDEHSLEDELRKKLE
jgi:hypothetical protein